MTAILNAASATPFDLRVECSQGTRCPAIWLADYLLAYGTKPVLKVWRALSGKAHLPVYTGGRRSKNAATDSLASE